MINYIASAGPHISVKVDEVFNIAGLSITNSHLVGILGLVALVWLMFCTRAAVLGKKKHNFATMLAQWTFDGLYNTVHQVIPDEKWARKVAPLCITLFFLRSTGWDFCRLLVRLPSASITLPCSAVA